MEHWSWGPGHVRKDPKWGRAQAQPRSSEEGECGSCQPSPPSAAGLQTDLCLVDNLLYHAIHELRARDLVFLPLFD